LDEPAVAALASSLSDTPSAGPWRRIYEDVAVRQGIKMGLAGMLAFACALWLRLPNPTWCLFTVVVLMVAQYMGAIVEKAMLRAIGTFLGAILGIALVGNFATEPAVMICTVFVVTAFGTMMFGGNLYPYAFFLTALTMLVVVGNTMENPARAWEIGLNRFLEITLGIIASTAVTGVLWPRYARLEFRRQFRDALREAGRVAVERSRRLLACEDTPDTDPEMAATETRFAARMNKLRLLIRFGQRESQYFRARVPIRRRAIGEMGALFEAAVSLGQRLPRQSRYRALIADELREFHAQLEREFEALVTLPAISEPENTPLQAAADRCDARLLEVRDQGATRDIPTQEAMDFSAHFTALRDIAARLKAIRACMHALHFSPEPVTPRAAEKAPDPFRVTTFWLRNGIKSGITATLALIYVNWLNPPGGLVMPFAAWLLTAMSKTYPGGEGDRRAFTYVIHLALAGIPYAVLLLALSPLLANYAWMNLFIFAGLFALGYTFTRQGGISLYGQCGMLFFVGAVGLNPQEPVHFPQILNCYFGVVLALLLSAVVQRMLWPVLPQHEIRALFAELFAICRELLEKPSPQRLDELQERIALIPTELSAWIRATTTPEYPEGETQRLCGLLASAERLSYCMLSARKLDEIEVPPVFEKLAEVDLENVRQQCREALQTFETAFARGAENPPTPPQSLFAAFQPLELCVGEARQKYLSGEASFPKAIAWLGAMNFLEDATRLIDLCAGQLRTLSIERYAGDYAL
jgi:uncharacterized membrane protein YccC